MELRMIKSGWKHPLMEGQQTFSDGSPAYRGLLKNTYAEDLASWQASHEDEEPPCKDDYMPAWAPGEATRFVMYETVSEGTPVSPDFATAEELARWLTLNPSKYVMGTYQQWMATIQKGSAFHGIIIGASGVLEAKTLHPAPQPVNIRITGMVSKHEFTFFCPESLFRKVSSLAKVRPEVTITETSPENYSATVVATEWGAGMWLDMFKRLLADLAEEIQRGLQLASVPE